MFPTLAIQEGLLIPIIAIVGGLALGGISIVFGIVKGIVETRAREETKRELAAYVAEGSMSPEDAERIVKADMPSWKKRCSA